MKLSAVALSYGLPRRPIVGGLHHRYSRIQFSVRTAVVTGVCVAQPMARSISQRVRSQEEAVVIRYVVTGQLTPLESPSRDKRLTTDAVASAATACASSRVLVPSCTTTSPSTITVATEPEPAVSA